ncbi:hypothetical protein [Brachybacterium vulturis]|uniref:hypothetical protein n=1 Tax=Brachybacterium vulturis TaxID=2017484 RepID=UPI0037366125
MDDCDDERFSRPALSSSPAARHARRAAAAFGEAGRRSVDGSREERLLGAATSPHAVRVRGLDEEERGRIREEVQLLAALEVAGITAAPAVLELEEEGYLREAAPALRHHGGRRAAESGTPPTGERRALARARESVDALIRAVHERGWVLGAPHARGLGARADGTVLLLDLRGLRRDESLSARQEDRRWADSVLEDQDRTLRRRVHLDPAHTEGDPLLLGDEPSLQRPRLRAAQLPAEGVEEGLVRSAPPQPALPVPRRHRRQAQDTLPPPSPVRSGAGRRVLSSIHEVLRQPRLRRTAVLSGALVLLMGTMVGWGTWWARDRAVTSTGGEHPVATAPADAAPRPAPRIEDPQMLVAELAGSRHAYVTGMSDLPTSARGSVALVEDERIRDAYSGITVRAGGPVVHAAQVIEQPGSTETAVLHAVTSMEELHLEQADGGTATVPATEPARIRMLLRWDGEQWRVVSAAPLATNAESGAS